MQVEIEGLGLLERFGAGADCLGEFVLIEFGRLRLPPARGDVFGGDSDGLDARLCEGERRQQKVLWPEFSWETVLGKPASRCFQMFAPDISRLGYDDTGRADPTYVPSKVFAHL